MSIAARHDRISVDDYLAGELQSEIKHEYLGGFVYAMAGAKNRHGRLSARLIASIGGRLRNSECEVYTSDTKIRIKYPNPPHLRFYYPDVSVVCDSNPDSDTFQDRPVVIAEVISESTRRTDEFEKLDAYKTIPSLMVYLLIEQDEQRIVAYRKTEDSFESEVYLDAEAIVPLPEIGAELPLAELYA